MKLTIEAEHACEIIDFLKQLKLEIDRPTIGNDHSNLNLGGLSDSFAPMQGTIESHSVSLSETHNPINL